MIQLSIALVTRNRPDSLNRCLESLRQQSVQPFEVVISDDSDPDQSNQIKAISDRWDCRYIRGPRRGLYANRNHIALACQGTHIRTMDDDHIFPEGHLEECLKAIRLDPQVIWTTGENIFINGKYHGGSPTAGQLNASGVAGAVGDIDDNWAIADGSTIYPREVFDQGHRMVESFNYGSSYLEFGSYLYQYGFKSRCIPGVIVEHYPVDSSIIGREYAPKIIKSHIFACICYNFHFKPNVVLGMRYILSKLARVSFDKECVQSTFDSLQKAQERWSASRLDI